ncbi:MAG: nodulation protein NodH [Pseudomonadota bacterium]
MAWRFKSFVLLANMRTGSNLFEQNINRYEGVDCHGELFNPHFVGSPGDEERFGVSLSERELKPQKLLNRMVSQDKDNLPGFRLFSDHDPRVLDLILADPTCAKIVLTRNPLDSYVSHAIARQTDQWRLTDASKRKTAKVNFDFMAFRGYLNGIQQYLTDIKRGLQHQGQSAFYIGYDDLNSVEVFNGLIRFLGGEEELKDLNIKIVRQNPEGLRDKVENYDQMIQDVRQIDLLGTEAVPVLEPVRNPGSKNFVAGSDAPMLFMAMEKGSHPHVAKWLRAHQTRDLDGNMNQKQLGDWLKAHPVRRSFTVISHPIERAYRAFNDHIFLTGDGLFPWIRTNLEKNYGVAMPPAAMCEQPIRTVLENSGYGVADHTAAFQGFLRFLKGNLQGQTRARIDQSWASQNSILQGYARLVIADEVFRDETLAADLARLENDMGLPSVELPEDDFDPCFSLSEIYSDTLEEQCQDVYARDYQMLGFGPWG